MTVNDAVAKRVVNLLAEKNMTQYRLEQNSGIQHGHMQWIMSGKSKTVTLSTVMMLANGFGMTVLEFLMTICSCMKILKLNNKIELVSITTQLHKKAESVCSRLFVCF